MHWRCRTFLPVSGIILVLFTIILLLMALASTWWAKFSARTELGKPQEDGHYGIWTVCSTKGPHWTEDCNALDTFFQVPSYLPIAGIFGILHLAFMLVILPIASLWAVHIFRNVSYFSIKPKFLCIAKVSLAFISAIFAILVAIFASVGENREKEYLIRKGWSFWIQIVIIGLNITLTILYVIENVKFWEERIRQHMDPEGTRAETYGNPTFDADSPELSRRRHSNNGAIAYTESSGHPYDPNAIINKSFSVVESKNNIRKGKDDANGKEIDSDFLTYENESYKEHSPGARRMNRNAC